MHLEILILLTPPAISLPTTTPPWPRSIRQLRISYSADGTLSSLPKKILLDLIAMQSSPTEITVPRIRTFWQDSGSMPSVFGEMGGLVMRTSMMSRSVQ